MVTGHFSEFLEMSSPQQSKFMIPSILMQSRLFSKTVLQCVLLTAEKTECFVFSNFRTNPGIRVTHLFLYISGCRPQREEDLQRCGAPM